MKKTSTPQWMLALALSLGLMGSQSQAMDFKWSGTYRIEGYQFFNPELDKGVNKSYGLHHLILRPEITAGDGFMIRARLDLLNSSDYPNSQLGQFFGHGPGVATPGFAGESNTLGTAQASDTVAVNELYLTYIQEHGALIVGRAPVHFGLGMTHNAGLGPFDHWLNNRDLLGYRVVMGNFYLLPMLAKVNEGDITQGEDVNELLFHAQYEDLETELEMGFFFQRRRGSALASDAPVGVNPGEVLGGTGATANDSFEIENFNFYVQRQIDLHKLGLEVGMQRGRSGVRTAGGEPVEFAGYGMAAEYEIQPQGSPWTWNLKAGYATGDSPATDEKFEGYLFHRNYNVAMMLFNQPLGQSDILRTDLQAEGPASRGARVDTETLSNVIYASPGFRYDWRDSWAVEGALTFGWLDTNPIVGQDVGKDLGFELDLALNYSPRQGVLWVNQVGMLFPGSAFEAGGQQDASFAWGMVSKAAISF